MKNSFYLLLLILVFSIAGCATSQDLKAVRSELNQKMEEKISAVDAELVALKKEQENNSSTVASMRKGNANSAADLSDLRETIQQLRGQLEALKKDMARDSKRSDEFKERLDSIAVKVNFIESFLEIGKKDSVSDVSDKGIKPQVMRWQQKTRPKSRIRKLCMRRLIRHLKIVTMINRVLNLKTFWLFTRIQSMLVMLNSGSVNATILKKTMNRRFWNMKKYPRIIRKEIKFLLLC